MKFLVYELFSGVGFCNQLFSLETAIYLANISNRKLILFIRNPLCHCGRSSWNYGTIMDFFNDDYKTYLPHGIEVCYRIIPDHYTQLLNDNEKTNNLVFGNKFSQIGFVDKDIYYLHNSDVTNNGPTINTFLHGRNLVVFDISTWTHEYIYINESNASRCFYNFLTSTSNYQLMSNICESLTHLHETFYCIFNQLTFPDNYIGIHFRFGDARLSTSVVNSRCNDNIQHVLEIIEKYKEFNKEIVIMSDRKDTLYLANINNSIDSNITYTEDIIERIDLNKYFPNITDHSVVQFLLQKYICEKANVFIGYEGSTVSNYIQYVNYIKNKPYQYYTNKNIRHNPNECSWFLNGVHGGGIGWKLFFPDNIFLNKDKYYIKHLYRKLIDKQNKKIISFSLYGIGKQRDEKRNFLKGMYVNYELAKQIYPDWICRVYIPYNESYKYIEPLLELKDLEVILVDTNTCLRALRFLPYDDKNVSVWISRDLDSVLNWREKVCVDEWLQRDELLHIMSDNRQHTWNVAGGMFGFKNDFKIDYTSSVLNISTQYNNLQNDFAIDCKITDDIFFNNYSHSYIQHYSSGKKLDNSLPFPSHNPIDSGCVGNIVNIDKYYKNLNCDVKYRLTKQVKLFNLDLHISVIEDIKNVFTNISSDIEITDWSISGHTWVFNKTKQQVKHVNADTWKQIDMNMINKFQEEYDDYLSTFDGFIVTHTPVFCLLFEKYNKPIFMVNSCRYVQPYCWNNGRNDDMLNELNKSLIRMSESRQLISISNNKGDQRFLELGTNIKSTHLPSLCLYTNSKYTGQNGKIIVTGTTRKDLLPNIENIVYKDDLGGRYEWSTLYNYKAIIVLPYEISTMSIFEYYSANVPMIFPSKTFLTDLIITGKYPNIGSKYFQFKPPECFDEAMYNQTNSTDYLNFWLSRADYYDVNNMPNILFFDSYDDLQRIINNTNFMAISEEMNEYNKTTRIPNVMKTYRSILQETFPKLSLIQIDNNRLDNINKNVTGKNKNTSSRLNITEVKYGPMSGYNNIRNQLGLEKYLQENVIKGSSILELGPGGGQWSRLLGKIGKILYCVDENSAEKNYFWNYVQKDDKIKYIHGLNNILTEVPDDSIDYIFSYDMFKFTSYDVAKGIINSLYKKCKIGSTLLISYADIYKFINSEPHRTKMFEKEFNVFNDIEKLKKIMEDDYNGNPRRGRWYWIGIQKIVELIEMSGFTVIERDLNIDKTNPITLFTKK